MQTRTFLTVIVPVYNAGPYLDAALASLAAQEVPDVEFIIIDDGSTDGSTDVCKEWVQIDPRFRLVSQPNLGVCAARNLGIRSARGEFIYLMDHDDRLAPGALGAVMGALDRSGADMAKFGLRYIIERPSGQATRLMLPTGGLLDAAGMGEQYRALREAGVFTFVWNGVVPRRFYQALGPEPFDSRFTVGGEDADLNFRLMQMAESCVFLPTIFYEHYRRAGQSTVLKRDPEAAANARHLANRELELMTHLGCARDVMRDVAINHSASIVLAADGHSFAAVRSALEVASDVILSYGAPLTVVEWLIGWRVAPRHALLGALASVGWVAPASALLSFRGKAARHD